MAPEQNTLAPRSVKVRRHDVFFTGAWPGKNADGGNRKFSRMINSPEIQLSPAIILGIVACLIGLMILFIWLWSRQNRDAISTLKISATELGLSFKVIMDEGDSNEWSLQGQYCDHVTDVTCVSAESRTGSVFRTTISMRFKTPIDLNNSIYFEKPEEAERTIASIFKNTAITQTLINCASFNRSFCMNKSELEYKIDALLAKSTELRKYLDRLSEAVAIIEAEQNRAQRTSADHAV